ncbi:hypothetical protein BCR41DRAFT_392352 [Lobosporangium transversale]|uniref:Uncharacterized protein n=1 Tax=Lobosporangium transversale TaxID=64571 RepID=A0A1Y2H1H4_9FUNG|nr:hypothetical protein BCR41DRAFT_392352 [Lobosporangium transversale]ORZ27894.1 hypothetical protein BCR41DRAFT_392352 [Lobosporangium transversale]|eukprot:XP_021885597.1 hypothetical protein BCR41DRAFT_392352 [Lobosporangium transversale]
MIEVASAIPVFGRDTYNGCFQRMSEESQTQTESKKLDVLQEFYESRWYPIKRHLVTQVKARGHFAVGVHEFNTNARCPRSLCDSFLEALYPRSKYCRACEVFFSRDAVGAENIARIGLAQIERQESPAKYKPPEESPAPAAKRARR